MTCDTFSFCSASRHPGNVGGVGPVGPGHREAERGGDCQAVRLRGRVHGGQSHLVAANQTPDMVHV